MKTILPIILLICCSSCKMQPSGNYFELQIDSAVSSFGIDKYGFESNPKITAFYIDDQTVNVYYEKKATQIYKIKSVQPERSCISYILKGSQVGPYGESISEYMSMVIFPEHISFGPTSYKIESISYKILSSQTLFAPPQLSTENITYQQIESYQNNGAIRGAVKTVLTKTYVEREEFGETVLNPTQEETFEYDKYGNVLTHSIYEIEEKTHEKRIILQELYKYNKNNLLTKECVEYDYWPSNFKKIWDIETQLINYEYNNFEKLTKIGAEFKTKYNDRDSYSNSSNLEFIYENDTILIEKNKYDKYGELKSKIKYKQTSQGRTIETIYDSKGNLKYETTYGLNGGLIDGYITEWLEHNDEVSKINFYSNNCNYVIQKVKQRKPRDITPIISRKISIYDKNSDILDETIEYSVRSSKKYYDQYRYLSATEHKSYSYIFDISGNWIKRKIETIDRKDPDRILYKTEGQHIIIEDRKIEYYN